MILVEEVRSRTFQPCHHGGGILGHNLRILRIAFIGAAPAVVARHRNRRRERPVHAGGAHLSGSDFADAAKQSGVVCRAQADIVWEKSSAIDIVVPMGGVLGTEYSNEEGQSL